MYDPCAQYPCKAHKDICRHNCTKYKNAVERDANAGVMQFFTA